MRYDYQYTVTAAAAMLFILVLCFQRRSYSSHRNRVFRSLIYSNLLAAAADIVTYRTISWPENYSLSFCYATNIIYLILYGIVAVNFLRYIAALTDNRYIMRTARNLYIAAILVETAFITTTPLTHWIIYYDEEGVYRHGSFFGIMYAIPIFLILIAVLAFYHQKMEFNYYQRMTVGTLFGVSIPIALFQILNPRVDLFHLLCTMIIYTIFIVFENPAYDNYHTTRCLNAHSFYQEAIELARKNQDRDMVLIGVLNRPLNQGIQEMAHYSRLLDTAAEKMYRNFGRHIYCVSDGKFILVVGGKNAGTPETAIGRLKDIFSRKLEVGGQPTQLEIGVRNFRLHDLAVSDDFIDHLIETIQRYPLDRLFTVDNLSRLVYKQHRSREVEDALINAAKKDAFYVEYQPIYDLHTGSFRSAEALIRLKDPDLGLISADEFIPIAEENRTILEIGEQIFRKVCRYIHDEKLPEKGMSFIDINVSPKQFIHKGMAERFIRIMQEYGINPAAINLEIVESALNLSNDVFCENIRILTEAGVEFSIDDYGSGFASADYLYKLPISIVKIDKDILWNAMKDPAAETVFRDTLKLIRKLDKKIIVEGAENEEMVEMIRGAGGDFIQGYYYSKPLGSSDFLQFIDHRTSDRARRYEELRRQL